jgi:hypothetical protein
MYISDPKMPLTQKDAEDIVVKPDSRMKSYFSYIATFAVGLAVACVYNSGSGSAALGETTQLWLDEPLNEFKWNQTAKLQFTQATAFVNIAVSPTGELVAVQRAKVEDKTYSLAYTFNFETGEWLPFMKDFQVSDIKFDGFGNYWVIDTQGQLYAKNSKTVVFMKNVYDYDVSTMGDLHIILNELGQNQQKGSFQVSDGQRYILYVKGDTRLVAVDFQQTIVTDKDGKTLGYGYQCISDVSIGTDSSVWAVGCQADSDGNFEVLKWDPFVNKWYQVAGKRGVKVAAFNEISGVVLDAFGRITFSSNAKKIQSVNYIDNDQSSYQNLAETKILTDKGKLFVNKLIKQYALATLCYRATEHGFDSAKFHAACDNKGPTISIIQANGRQFGGFTSLSWKGNTGYQPDKYAFLFSVDKERVFPIKEGGANAIYDSTGYGPTYGNGHDIYVASNSNQNTNSYTNFGSGYKTYELGDNTQSAKEFFAGAYNFKPDEIEVYYLI